MASRQSPLFKPSSFKLPSGTPVHARTRPPFARSTSGSSAKSTTSDESLVTTLKNLTSIHGAATVDDHHYQYHADAHHVHTHAHTRSASSAAADPSDASGSVSGLRSPKDGFIPPGSETPGRKRSKPITIQLPGRDRPSAYTPLSARGELQGGYFPNHEEIQRSYRGHPFEATLSSSTVPPSYSHHSYMRRPISSPTMSTTSSPLCSPFSENTPTQRHAHYPTSTHALPPMQAPDFFLPPHGKYYPSNYKKPVSTTSSPKNSSSPEQSRPSSRHMHLSLPMTPARPSVHQRRPSEVRQKLQQYQRQMIEQARLAREHPGRAESYTYGQHSTPAPSTSPKGPKLAPVVLPASTDLGGITPLELEIEPDSYMSLAIGARLAHGHEPVSV